jgi:methyl-accepting chemotaxis protein
MVRDIIQTKKPAIGLEPGRGGMAVRAIAPIFWDEEYVGSVEVSITLDEILKKLKSQRENIAFLAFPETARVITRKQFSKVGDLALISLAGNDFTSFLKSDFLNQARKGETIKLYHTRGLGARVLKGYKGREVGLIVVDKDLSQMGRLASKSLKESYIIIVLFSVLGAVIALREAIYFVRRIKRIVHYMKFVEEGDLRQEVSAKRHDELGQFATSFNLFLGNLRKLINEVKEQTNVLSQAAEELENTSEKMSGDSFIVHEKIKAILDVSKAVANRTETVNHMMLEMEKAINEISSQTGSAAEVARLARTKIEEVSPVMEELEKRAQEIGEVVSFIISIADQTNLLALNATIEAARAGEAGKGFTVVANEVKELARQTAEATENISAKIRAIQESAKRVGEATQGVAGVIAQVNDISDTIAATIEEQSVSVSGIKETVDEVAHEAGILSRIVPELEKVAEDTIEAMNMVKQKGESLLKIVYSTKELVGRFKT